MHPSKRALALAGALLCVQTQCGTASRVSWPGPDGPLPAGHAEVRTLNGRYNRVSSQVLVRQVTNVTRANLDWAAYHANFMIADPAPEAAELPTGTATVNKPFKGLLDEATLSSSIARTTLTEDERVHPLAFAPLAELIAAKLPGAAGGIEDLAAAVRGENWGQAAAPSLVRQVASDLFVHKTADGSSELWLKVEFQPWFKALGSLPDEDDDGFPEIYGRVRADLVSPDALAFIAGDYTTKVLSAAEVKAWANQLSSYWYPSYNTDLVGTPKTWPDAQIESGIRSELGAQTFAEPTIVLRGKPQGKPTYNVFLLKTGTPAAVASAATPAAVVLKASKPTPKPAATGAQVARELAAHGGSWEKWAAQVVPFRDVVRAKLKATPAKAKGVPGVDGFLFYRTALESVVGGDFEKQPKGKNPLPVILEFKRVLEEQQVDFLFVPVPNKVEIFPDKLDASLKAFVGQVVNPFERKFAASLSGSGVELLDLWPALLAARTGDGSATGEALYQRQDTHWSHRGLEIAAHAVAERIKQYPWYADLARHRRTYQTKDVPFTRYGDLHSRLPEVLKARYKPEAIVGKQVITAEGPPYDDDAESPIVVLGDSFTGVYELTDCEHAGVSAHIAREIGYPVDLVMSYGGGPNVRQKLMRRGVADLAHKRLVIWMMTSRDLHNYWEDWQPLKPGQP